MDNSLSLGWAMVIVAVALWDVVWKGIGLWRSARRYQTGWFMCMLVLNTAGLLPILYLILHRKDTPEPEL